MPNLNSLIRARRPSWIELVNGKTPSASRIPSLIRESGLGCGSHNRRNIGFPPLGEREVQVIAKIAKV
jgi:hypothetical protein